MSSKPVALARWAIPARYVAQSAWTGPAALVASALCLWLMPAWTAGLGAALLCLAGLWAWQRRAQAHALATLRSALETVADGDLSRTVQTPADQELGRMASRLESMQQAWSRLVANIRSEAELAAIAGEQLLVGARALSSRTEEQAATLEQTTASVAELAASVQRNADAARSADERADAVRQGAERGMGAVEQAVDAVLRIEERSRQMSQIIGAIDGIAFQTNILALNAAVEAARAGESGRGFAVVASEVRVLAGRTAEAAAEVRQLIQGSAGEVAAGVTHIREVNQMLGQMAEGMRTVAQQVREVAGSTAAQSLSLGEIAQAVSGIDQLTQRNSQMVEASVHAADQLRQQALSLKRGVITMRLRQGCADEARALTERACECLRQRGLAGAASLFHDKNGGFIDRDLFVIVLDRQGWFRAFGADASKADKPATLPPGVDVDDIVRRTLSIADAGGGWLEFRSWHPVTRTPVDKMAYVLPFESMAVMVSANKADGAVVAEAASAPAAAPARARLPATA